VGDLIEKKRGNASLKKGVSISSRDKNTGTPLMTERPQSDLDVRRYKYTNKGELCRP
jgi:hypothetical protein